jgi:hypothetical protein
VLSTVRLFSALKCFWKIDVLAMAGAVTTVAARSKVSSMASRIWSLLSGITASNGGCCWIAVRSGRRNQVDGADHGEGEGEDVLSSMMAGLEIRMRLEMLIEGDGRGEDVLEQR